MVVLEILPSLDSLLRTDFTRRSLIEYCASAATRATPLRGAPSILRSPCPWLPSPPLSCARTSGQVCARASQAFRGGRPLRPSGIAGDARQVGEEVSLRDMRFLLTKSEQVAPTQLQDRKSLV